MTRIDTAVISAFSEKRICGKYVVMSLRRRMK
jgi:hypothetical protein